jgi:hypothetical protein
MSNLVHEITEYGADVDQLWAVESLPDPWLKRADYLAIKAANSNHFEKLLELLKTDEIARAKKMTCTTVNERPFVTVTLIGELIIGRGWGTKLLNIAGPRPGEETQEDISIDHVCFQPRENLNKVARMLKSPGISMEHKHAEAGGHTSLNVTFEIGGKTRMIKLGGRSLMAVVYEESRAGLARTIYQADEEDEKS